MATSLASEGATVQDPLINYAVEIGVGLTAVADD
jgi:hypothetical protein